MSLEDYEKELNRRKLSKVSIFVYLNSLRLAERFLGKPLDKSITKKDIERYLDSISAQTSSTITLRLIALKLYFKWLYEMKKGYPDVVDMPLPKKSNNGLISSDLLTEEEIIKLINVADNLRDKAVISLLYDSACRISEITNLNIEDIIIETDRTGYITVNGKTGKRQVPLSFSIPSLKNWLNSHPSKDNPKAPLFCSLHQYFGKRLVNETIRHTIQAYVRRVKINKRVFCHLFRHSRLTDLDKKGLSHTAMKYYAGWSKNSNMPSVYSHFSAQDTKDLIYQADGITKPKIKKTILEPIICVKCSTPNDQTNKYCYLCGMALDKEAQKDFEIEELLKLLIKSDPELSKTISKKIEALKLKTDVK